MKRRRNDFGCALEDFGARPGFRPHGEPGSGTVSVAADSVAVLDLLIRACLRQVPFSPPDEQTGDGDYGATDQ